MGRRGAVAGATLLATLVGGGAAYRTATARAATRTIGVGATPWAMAVDPRSGHAFVVNRGADGNGAPTGAGHVTMLDLRDGTVLRTVAVGTDPRAIAVDPAAGRVLVAGDDASVSILDARMGARVRTVRVGAEPQAIAVDARTGRAFVVDVGDGTIVMLDVRRGTILRTTRLPIDSYRASAAVDERAGRVVIADTRASGGGEVNFLDARSGGLVRTTPLTGFVRRVAVDGAGHAYVTGSAGVSVLDTRSGRVVRTLSMGDGALAVAADPRRGRIFVARRGPVAGGGQGFGWGVATGPGSLIVADARTWQVVRTVAAGIMPVSLSVDEGTGCVSVVDAGGGVAVPDPWGWLPPDLRRHIPLLPRDAPVPRPVPGGVTVLDVGA